MSKPRILSTSTVARSRLFRVEALDLRFRNGRQANFECLKAQGNGVVMVAAVDGDECILVREYAVGFDRYELGFVKGKIDAGETAAEAARRELAEEIGYAPDRLEVLRWVTTSPGYSDFRTHLFLASGLKPTLQQGGDEIEPLEPVRWPLDRMARLYDHAEVTDARTLYLLQWLERRYVQGK